MKEAYRGSVCEQINNEESRFDWDLNVCLLNGIFSALTYFHNSEIGYHGRLNNSHKCVVDSRWICKLTDHGLTYIRETE